MASNQDIPNGIYYIVVADIVGSSSFSAKWDNASHGARTQAFIEASKIALNSVKLDSNVGRFIKAIGDGALLVFSHFPDIIHWWAEFVGQLTLAAIRHPPTFQVRVCIHAGELRFVDGDPSDLATNQVFKMEKHAGADEVVLSDIAYMLARPSLYPKQFGFKRHGSAKIAGYTKPMMLYRLVNKSVLAFLIQKTARK